jgi:hypothetical protein
MTASAVQLIQYIMCDLEGHNLRLLASFVSSAYAGEGWRNPGTACNKYEDGAVGFDGDKQAILASSTKVVDFEECCSRSDFGEVGFLGAPKVWGRRRHRQAYLPFGGLEGSEEFGATL